MNVFAAVVIFLLTAGFAGGQHVLVAADERWDYLLPVTGVDPSTADPDFNTTWQRAAGYDGPAFTTGVPAPFHYGGLAYLTGLGIPLTTWPTPDAGKRFTAYMRTTFTATQNYPQAQVEIVADDGAVIYLDGVEVKRVNFAAAKQDQFTVFADGVNRTEDNVPTESGPPLLLPIGAISQGPHILSVSVHNSDAGSTDLGIHLRLLGSAPPPAPMLIREIGGVNTNILLEGTAIGWDSPRAGAWRMNGNGAGGPYAILSEPVDLSTVGEAHFSMLFYHYEVSATSNFETTDEFGARLALILDDDSSTEINLIPAAVDTDANGTLTGEEFAPGRGIADSVFITRFLTATIPANVKSARLLISGMNDSPTENFLWGNARISDIVPGSDADQDGQTREDELLAGTNPSDGKSLTRIGDVVQDNTGAAPALIVGIPLTMGKHYMLETSPDGTVWGVDGDYLPPQNYTGAIIDFKNPRPPALFYRLRVLP